MRRLYHRAGDVTLTRIILNPHQGVKIAVINDAWKSDVMAKITSILTIRDLATRGTLLVFLTVALTGSVFPRAVTAHSTDPETPTSPKEAAGRLCQRESA